MHGFECKSADLGEGSLVNHRSDEHRLDGSGAVGHGSRVRHFARMSWGGRTITVVQYWRSFDQLEAFAKNPNDPHLPAWKAFNKRVGAGGDVGVYHEADHVGAGQYESIYSNMPVMGLAAAGTSVAVGKRSETARARIAG